MNETELIHPLKDVWLRPRAVFRALARQPLTVTDYILAALTGVSNYLLLLRWQPELKLTGLQLFSNAVLYGSITGLLVTWFYAAVYARLGSRMGRAVTRPSVYHVLAYGSVPLVATLILSLGGALLIGEAIFVDKPQADTEGFVLVLIRLQILLVVLLYLWSVLLQIMGFSELLSLSLRRSFGVWVLGQVIGALSAIFLRLLMMILLPGLVPAS